jgi:hypothetical protein
MKNAYHILVGRPEGRDSRVKLYNKIKAGFKENSITQIILHEERMQSPDAVSRAMNLTA